jgi:hypothetical protein
MNDAMTELTEADILGTRAGLGRWCATPPAHR